MTWLELVRMKERFIGRDIEKKCDHWIFRGPIKDIRLGSDNTITFVVEWEVYCIRGYENNWMWRFEESADFIQIHTTDIHSNSLKEDGGYINYWCPLFTLRILPEGDNLHLDDINKE